MDDVGRPPDLKQLHRSMGAYLSVRDQQQLVIKSIETEHIEDEQGVPFSDLLWHQRKHAQILEPCERPKSDRLRAGRRQSTPLR